MQIVKAANLENLNTFSRQFWTDKKYHHFKSLINLTSGASILCAAQKPQRKISIIS